MAQAQIDNFFSRFDEWWEAIGPATRAGLDAQTARISFVAACRMTAQDYLRESTSKVTKQYRFQCGRWKVTVTASNMEAAKLKAIQALDRRAAKFMTTGPRGGWTLSLIKDDHV